MAQQLSRAEVIVGAIKLRKTGLQVFAWTGAPVNGGAGTHAGLAPRGSLLIRYDTANVYQNTGTKASPTWSAIGTVAGLTATGAELNVLAGVTGGVALASKGVVLDANLQVGGIRRQIITKAVNYAVAAGDSGGLFIATAADIVFTLPVTATGLDYRFTLTAGALSAGVGIQVAPAAADKIMGNGFTSADNKAAILSGASDREGDSIHLMGDGVDGWQIVGVTGTWARAA